MKTIGVAVLLVTCVSGFAADVVAQGFTDVTKESGVAAVVEKHRADVPKWWFSGIDLVDVDADGHLDLYLGAHGQISGAGRNDGKGHFTYVEPRRTENNFRSADPVAYPGSEIQVMGDVDEDGKVDLLVTWRDGGGRWYLNGTQPGGAAAWLFKATGMTADAARQNTLADLDRDGKLDWIVYAAERAPGAVVRRGDGKGTFEAKGLAIAAKPGIFVDLDADGDLDSLSIIKGGYDSKVCTRGIFINDPSTSLRAGGKMGFTDRTRECGLGVDGNIHGVGDVNADGFPDILCLENVRDLVLYLNDGKGHFTVKADAFSGMRAARKPSYASWGRAIVVDLDNDGIVDILMNGRHFLWVLRGTGEGKFEYVNRTGGIRDLAWAAVDEGLCFGDIDADGDLDVIGFAGKENPKTIAVYRNDLPKRHWLRVRPVGAAGNRMATGAKIRLTEPGSGKLLAYEQVAVWGKQACHSYYAYPLTDRHFGLGDRTTVDVAVEFYPSGKTVGKKGVQADTTLEIHE